MRSEADGRTFQRVAALYDIHGNVPALEAVLAQVSASDVDGIVIGGDVVPGPMPREALALLCALAPAPLFVRGNCETEVLGMKAGVVPEKLPSEVIETIRWTAEQLDDPLCSWMRSWKSAVRLVIDGVGRVLFCHATPRSETEIFTKRTPAERLEPIFAAVDADVVVCGHTHMQFDRTVGSVRVVNAGSVGMPFGEPGAYWLELGPDVGLRRTPYDLEAGGARIRASTYPSAADFVEKNVLHPPAEADVIDRFEHVSV